MSELPVTSAAGPLLQPTTRGTAGGQAQIPPAWWFRKSLSRRMHTFLPAGPVSNAYVYAIGQVEPRFPNLAIHREYAQVVGRYDTQGRTDRQTMQFVLSQRENRYLARGRCAGYSFTVEQLPMYLLVPRDPADIDLLIETLRADSREQDLDVLIGIRGPLYPPTHAEGWSFRLLRSISSTHSSAMI